MAALGQGTTWWSRVSVFARASIPLVLGVALLGSFWPGAKAADLKSLTLVADQPRKPILPGVPLAMAVGGNAATGTVTLDVAAPAGGETVSLESSNVAVVSVPATVVVRAGMLGASFAIATKVVPKTELVIVTATLRAVGKRAVLSVGDDVTAYAKACYTRLKIAERDFAGPFNCKNGEQLLVQKDGKNLDIAVKDVPNPNAATGFPADCDFPAWLPNSDVLRDPRDVLLDPRGAPIVVAGRQISDGKRQCYGNSFIQQLKIAGNNDFEGALLCRHKADWAGVCSEGPRNGKRCGDGVASNACGVGGKCILGDKDFPDIAMILYNKDNGETCWFQTDDRECTPGEKRCDGTKVPAPHVLLPAAQQVSAQQVFLPPSDTAGINCVRCHDNGPWMNSRWMDNARKNIGAKALTDTPDGPYLNNGAHFDKWAKTTFVTVKRDGLPKGKGDSCTRCHKIHAKEITPDATPPFANLYGRDYLTLLHWLDYSVALDFAPGTNATGKQKDEDHALWMPPGHEQNLDGWNKIYKPHIDALRACMEKKGVETDENTKKGSNCAVRKPAPTNPAPGSPGARLRGDLSGGTPPVVGIPPIVGTTPIVNQVTPSCHFSDPAMPVSSMTSVLLSWDADSNFHACAIEASFPPGVPRMPADAGNWVLQDSPVWLGPFTVPGEYRFDMYCEDEQSANFSLLVAEPAPGPKLHIEAIVDGFARPRATNIPGPTDTTANARVVDPIFVYWGAESVKDNCVVTELRDPGAKPTGKTFPGGSGYIKVALAAGGNDQIYLLTCTGADDNKPYSVKTTLHPTASVVCDVNGDGSIDKADIDLIFARRNFAAVPNDRREVQVDGKITVNDARICATRCKNPKCTP